MARGSDRYPTWPAPAAELPAAASDELRALEPVRVEVAEELGAICGQLEAAAADQRLTHSEWARSIPVSRSALLDVLHGRVWPRLWVLAEMADVVGSTLVVHSAERRRLVPREFAPAWLPSPLWHRAWAGYTAGIIRWHRIHIRREDVRTTADRARLSVDSARKLETRPGHSLYSTFGRWARAGAQPDELRLWFGLLDGRLVPDYQGSRPSDFP